MKQLELFGVEKIVAQEAGPEEWVDIPEFDGYECSTHGRFRRKDNAAILAGTVSHNGYVHIGFTKGGKQQWRLAHRVIASAFLANPDPETHEVVNHKDSNRVNNKASNLEWCTRRANALHWVRGRESS